MTDFKEGLKTTQRGTRNSIREDLKSGYRPGFPVLREIVQNAVDRHAKKVVVAAFDNEDGLGGTHPGLTRPGLLFVNDGPFEAGDADRLLELADSAKAGDGSAIGRFGIGRIALLNYCDVFFFAAYESPDVLLAIGSANPYDDTEPGRAWTLEHGTGGDDADTLIRQAVRKLGFKAAAFAIWVPLRRDATLVPDDEDTLAATVREAPSIILEEFRSEADLLDLFALTQLQEIGFAPHGAMPPVHRYQIAATGRNSQFQRASRKNEEPLERIGGIVHHTGVDGERVLGRFVGREIESDDAVFAAATDEAENNAAVRALKKERPFGSVVLVQPEGAQGLSIEQASFLPLHDENRTTGTARLYLNAAFLVRKDRTIPLADGYEGKWNAALTGMVVPLIAPVLLDAFKGGFFKEADALIRVVETVLADIGTDHPDHAHALVRDGMLAQTIDPDTGKAEWTLCPDASKTRSLPPGWRPDGGRYAPYPLSGASEMLAKRSMTAIEHGTALCVEMPAWSHDEIEAVLDASGGDTLTHPTRAVALLDFLRHAGRNELRGISGLLCRRLAKAGQSQVKAGTIADIIALATPWPVISRPEARLDAMRDIAVETGMPTLMRGDWIPEGWRRTQLDAITLGAVLRVLSAAEGASMTGDEANLVALAAWRATRDPMADPANGAYRVFRMENLFDNSRETLSFNILEQRAKGDLVFAPRPDEIERARVMAKTLDLKDAVRIDSGARDILGSGGILSLSSLEEYDILARCARYTGRNEGEASRLALFSMLAQPEQNPRAFRMLALGAANDERSLVTLGEDDRENEALSRAIADIVAATGKALVPGAFIESRTTSIRNVMKIERVSVDMISLALDPLVADKLTAIDTAAREALIAWLGDKGASARLHTGQDGRLHRANKMTREEAGGRRVPEALKEVVPILLPSRNADAVRVQERLVHAWNVAREIEVFLGLPDPASHARAILAALDAICDPLPESTRKMLERTPWLPRPQGDPLCPSDVLDLPDNVVEASRVALDGRDAPFVLPCELDPGLTTLRGWEVLVRSFPDKTESRAAILLRIGDAKMPALLGDEKNLGLLRKAANAGLSDESPACNLLCALLRMDGETQEVIDVFLPLSDGRAMNARLQALGRLCISEKSKAFHSLLYAAFVATVGTSTSRDELHIRLSGTLALSVDGTLQPVEALTRIDAEVMPKYRLDPQWSSAFSEHSDVESDETSPAEGLQGQDALLDVLEPFYAFDAEKTLRLYTLFTARKTADTDAIARFSCTEAEMTRARTALRMAVEGDPAHEDKDVINFYFDRNITVTVLDQAESSDMVPGLTGFRFKARLSEANDIWIKSEMDGFRCHVTLRRVADPVFDEVAGMLLRCAEKMVRSTFDSKGRIETVHGLMPHMAEAVLALFAGETASDQAGIASALRYIDENIQSRIDQLSLPRGGVVRRAQLTLREAQEYGRPNALSAFREDLRDEEALVELREAVCNAIRKLGYSDDGSTTVFELYQNARDALLQAAAPTSRIVRVTLADGCLALLHHGRAVNGHEGNPERARELGWDRDLINMLSLNQSEKNEGDIGQFGLGFKCVHMLSAEPRIASGNAVAARIRGGFLPEAWPEGRRRLREDKSQHGATLIELPLAPEEEALATRAFETFRDSVAGLLLFTRTTRDGSRPTHIIDGIECRRADKLSHWSTTVQPVINHIDRIAIAGTEGAQTWITIQCAGGSVLAIPLMDGIPVRKPKGADFWQLAPLSGLSDTAAWMLDGPFDVDAGRMNIQGDEKARGPIVRKATEGLSEALIALYDAGADALGMNVDPVGFWSALSMLFIDDCGANALMRRALHSDGGGWSKLAATRPVLPDITGTPCRIDKHAHKRLSDDLAGRADAIVALGRGKGLFGKVLTSAAGETLGLPNMQPKDLLIDELDRDPVVTPDRADRLYDVFHDLPGLLDTWRRARFRNVEGDLHPPQRFVPDARNGPQALDHDYGQKGHAIIRIVQVPHGGEAMPVVHGSASTGPDASEVLRRVWSWWQGERNDQVPAYQNNVYPDWFDPTALDTRITDEEPCDQAWFTFLALAIFQTLPYNRDRTNLSFLKQDDVAEHWGKIAGAAGQELADFKPWHDMLNAWFDKDRQVITFGTWRRSFPDLYMARRYLDDYRQLFFSLPEAGRQDMVLNTALTPAASMVAQRFGANAPPLARSLGNGAPWMIRELIRHGIYNAEEADHIETWCWASRARMVDRFYAPISCAPSDGTAGARSKSIYQALLSHTDEELLRFNGDYDLPIDILTRPENRGKLETILRSPS